MPYPTFSLSARGILENFLVYFYGVCAEASFLAAKFFGTGGPFLLLPSV